MWKKIYKNSKYFILENNTSNSSGHFRGKDEEEKSEIHAEATSVISQGTPTSAHSKKYWNDSQNCQTNAWDGQNTQFTRSAANITGDQKINSQSDNSKSD